jgi:hypothetical protein
VVVVLELRLLLLLGLHGGSLVHPHTRWRVSLMLLTIPPRRCRRIPPSLCGARSRRGCVGELGGSMRRSRCRRGCRRQTLWRGRQILHATSSQHMCCTTMWHPKHDRVQRRLPTSPHNKMWHPVTWRAVSARTVARHVLVMHAVGIFLGLNDSP